MTSIVKFIPADGPAVPMVQALTGPGRVVECMAVDLRASGDRCYLMLFDSATEPEEGAEPSFPAWPICEIGGEDFPSDAPFLVTNGAWLAVSASGLVYEALAASQDWTIGARVTP